MNELLLARTSANLDGFTLADARASGLNSKDLTRLLRRGEIRRVGRAAYVRVVPLDQSRPDVAHAAAARAVVASNPGFAAAGPSALVLLGLPALSGLSEVHVARRSPGRSRRGQGYRAYRYPGPAAFASVAGVACVRPELAVLMTAAQCGVRAGVVAADAALRLGLTTQQDLRSWLGRMGRFTGVASARKVVELADGRSESVGESLTRLLLAGLGYAADLQVRLAGRNGRVVARVDFLLRGQRVVVEFDGAVKYGGDGGRSALIAEKCREDEIRSLGYAVVRLVWADLEQPGRVRSLIEQAIRLTAS